MAEDVPYLVYVGDIAKPRPPEAQKSASQSQRICLEPDVARDDPEVYGDAEYLDFSTEEEVDSNTEDDEPEFNNEVEMVVVEEPPIKMETETREENIIQEQEASQVQQASSKWTHAATVNLIEAFQSHETSLVTGTTNMSEVWDKVASKLQDSGCNFTPLQCKNKFVSLKQIYDKIKEQEILCGKSVKEWLYLDLMKPIMTEMEKYRSYTKDAWDSPNCEDVKDKALSNYEDTQKADQPVQGTYKWGNSAILLLIDQFRKYQSALEAGSISQKNVFRLIEKTMQREGYNVTAAQCVIKYHSLKKTYKNIKEYNQVHRVIPRRWRYYDLIDSMVKGTPESSSNDPLKEVSETLAEIKSEDTTSPHFFKWSRRAIEILATAYRDHRPPLHDSKMSMSRRKVWQIVVQKLRKAGFDVNIPQCKSKISGMLKLYKRKRAGARSRAWSEKGNWYSKLIESIAEKPPKSIQREVTRRVDSELQRIEAGKGMRKADNMSDQLIICEENKKRRYPERQRIEAGNGMKKADNALDQLITSEENKKKRHPELQRIEAGKEIKRADNMLDQLIIFEENKERRHRENREQRQQLIDIMRQLVDKL